jgi:transcription elongation factor Elf1
MLWTANSTYQITINTFASRKRIEGKTELGRYKINLAEIGGDGEFSCPRCGEIISPDDDSGKVYDVLETVEKDGLLEKVTIECKKCRSTIQLEGFNLLKEVGYSDKMFDPDDYLHE